MPETKIVEIVATFKELGIPDTLVGLMRARFLGLITAKEYYTIRDWAHAKFNIPRDWFRVLVWSVPE